MVTAIFVRLFSLSFLLAIPAMAFERDPALYSTNSEPEWSYAMSLFQRIHFKGDERVLDLGCADGKIASTIAYRVPRGSVVATDSSKRMISCAKERYGSNCYGNLNYVSMDTSHISLESEYFDLIFSFSFLHSIPDKVGLLKQVASALKPQGRFAFTVPLYTSPALERAAQEMMASRDWAGYFFNFHSPYSFTGPEEYTQLLVSHGFAIKRIEVIPTRGHRFRVKGGLRKHLSHSLPHLEYLPKDKRDLFLDEFLETYEQILLQDPTSQDFERLEVEVIKQESVWMVPFQLARSNYPEMKVTAPVEQR